MDIDGIRNALLYIDGERSVDLAEKKEMSLSRLRNHNTAGSQKCSLWVSYFDKKD
jgi:hypothetical protein